MSKKILSEIYIIIAAVLWGLIGISVTGLSELGFSRQDIVFIRSFVAFAALGIWLLLTDRASFKIRIKDIWCFIGTGILSLMFFNICYFNAMKYTSLGIAAVLLYTAPAFVTIMSAIIFKEKINGIKIISLAAMFFGCACVTGVFDEKASFNMAGILFGIGSGFGYALYSIFSRFAIDRGYSSATISLYTFLFSAGGSAFITNFDTVLSSVNYGTAIGYSLFIGIICCTLPYILYTKGLLHTENSKASILAMIEPLIATVTGVLLYSDELSAWKIAGIAIMFAAIGFMNLKSNK